MDYDKKTLQDLNMALPAVFKFLTDRIKTYISIDNRLECLRADQFFDQYFKIHPDFAKEHKDEYEELILLQRECQWVALPVISEDKAINCYRKYINIASGLSGKYEYIVSPDKPDYWINYFLRQKLEDRLDTIMVLKERDVLKNKIQEALKNSEELIGTQRLLYNGQSLKQTLSNWFLNYFDVVGTGTVNKLKAAEFFSQDKNFQKLDKNSQLVLKTVFKIYEQCKISSTNPYGLETELPYNDGKVEGTMKYGVLEKVSDEEKKYFEQFVQDNKDTLLKDGRITEDYLKPKDEEIIYQQNNNIEEEEMISDIPQYKPTDQPVGLKHDIYGSEDEQEIEKHKYSGLKKDRSLDINAILAELKEKLDLMFKAPEEEMQFNNLCTSYLKGVRDEIEFVGMLDYKTEMAEKIVDFLKKYRPAMPVKLPKQPLPSKSAPKMPTYSQAQNIMKKSVVSSKAQDPKAPAPMPTRQVPQPPKPTYMPQVKRMESTKPVIQDIKVPAKDVRLIGPVEELGSFTLAKFRRLADTPVEAAEKIKEKVDLLEEQSITAKAKGIVAFKNSPLNQIYLKIGNASIDQGRSVAEIISELSQKGQEYLTKEEFDCIADLNKKLRF